MSMAMAFATFFSFPFAFLASQPIEVALVFHIEVTVFYNDQVHVLDHAYCEERECIAEYLAHNHVCLCCAYERRQDAITIHHTEKRVGRIAEVIEIGCKSPEG